MICRISATPVRAPLAKGSRDPGRRSPGAVERRVREAGLSGVRFQQADLLNLPFAEGAFDHVFLCFVLEHLPDPDRVLRSLARVVRPGGTVTAIEGDHGSTFFYPDDAYARRAIEALVKAVKRLPRVGQSEIFLRQGRLAS